MEQLGAEHARAPVPVVDIEDPGATAAVRAACKDHGFFYVTNTGISADLVGDLFQQSRAFFSLSEEQKSSVKINSRHRGYAPTAQQTLDPQHSCQPDAVESFRVWNDLGAEVRGREEVEACANQWPPANILPDFQAVVQDYLKAVIALSDRVRHLIAGALGLPEEYFDQFFQHPSQTLALLHYPPGPNSADEGAFGCGAHSDWPFCSLLVDDGNPGLQLHYKGSWLDVAPMPGTLLVNVADMLEFWSGGVFKSPEHRVVKPDHERFSSVLFVTPDFDAKIGHLPTDPERSQNVETTVEEFLDRKWAAMWTDQPKQPRAIATEG